MARIEDYTMVLQRNEDDGTYEAYFPTLFSSAGKFLPGDLRVGKGLSPLSAVEAAFEVGSDLLSEFSRLSILPPRPDIGDSFSAAYAEEEDCA